MNTQEIVYSKRAQFDLSSEQIEKLTNFINSKGMGTVVNTTGVAHLTLKNLIKRGWAEKKVYDKILQFLSLIP